MSPDDSKHVDDDWRRAELRKGKKKGRKEVKTDKGERDVDKNKQ